MMDANNGARREPAAAHKTMRQKLERVESSLNAVPPAMEEAVEGLESHCTAGIKLASLLETVLQDSPLVLLACRYKEACETLLDKTSRTSLTMKGELVAPVKRLGPTVSRLRSRIDSHSKAASRHESYRRQLETVTLSSSTSRNKLEQVEAKFRSSAQEFAHEDEQLILANTEFSQMRTELMGGCFLGYLEVVSRVLESASDLLAPLGAYKELRHDLRDSPASSTLKEATVSWLAATQINQNLRSFGGLSRNDVQCMLYQHPDGLPDTIRSGLNGKVDKLLKLYSTELARVDTPHHVVTGGFHFNPKAIELALKDCCSELEAKGAGADHAYTLEAKEEQISCDVPRTMYIIGDQRFGAATGEQAVANIREKKTAVRQLLESLKDNSNSHAADATRQQILDDFAHHVLNESCTTVTNTTAKTAVQLVFGKANLVLVRPSPSPEDNKAIRITAQRHDGTLTITVPSSWWLVEDYAAFAVLERPVDPSATLGVVDACYTIALSLDNYCNDSPFPELPSVAVTYRQPPSPSPSPSLAASPPRLLVGSKEKEKLLGSFTTLRNKFRNISQKTRGRVDGGQKVIPIRTSASLRTYVDIERSSRDKGEEERGIRKVSSNSESEPVPSLYGTGQYPSSSSSSGRGDSFGRGVRPAYPRHGIRRSGSDDTISSQSTLVPHNSLLASDDHPLGIVDLMNVPSRPTLTKSRVLAHDKYRQQGYQGYRADGRKPGKEEEEREEEGKDDDRRTVEGSPSSHDISIVSEEEMQRVFTLLSSKKPLEFEDYQFENRSGYQQQRKGGYDDHHGDRYKASEGNNYAYKYGYGSGEYGGEGEREGRRERGYPEGEQKERDNTSSGSSGIEDPYGRRSRSGSAASLHHDVEGGRERTDPRVKGSTAVFGSTDSGIGGAAHQGQGGGERGRGEDNPRQHGSHSQELPFDFSKGLGSLIHTDPQRRYDDPRNYNYHSPMFEMEAQENPPVSSSSSGGSSPVMFRTRSEENLRLPERSASRSSTHSMPPGPLHGSSTSLNDFDHTPGSRPRPHDYTHLSQGSLDDPSYWNYHHSQQKPPPEHFAHPPYNYNVPPGGPHGGPHGGPYNYDGRYGDHPHERHSRPIQRGGRVHSEDYSPSPGPPLDHRHQPPHYWPGPGFDRPPPQGGPPPQMPPLQMPPPPGPPGSRLHPPGFHDNRFRFRPIAPSTPSPAMSPGRSPHPTPPPTPPPPHGPMRPPQVHGPPPMPAPYHSPGPHSNMHPPRDFRPPPPQMGPPHGYQGPMPPREPNFGPPPRFGPSPSPGPPVSAPGRFPPGPPWDHGHGWSGPH